MGSATRSKPTRLSRPLEALALVPWLLTLAVTIVQITRGLGQRIVTGDWAVLVLRAREVGTPSTPFTGAWSRYGWAHPGPALQFALALPVRLLDSVPGGMATALVVNVLASIAILLLSRRAGAVVAAAAGLAVLALATHEPYAAVDFWNASLVVLPLAAMLLASLEMIRHGAPDRLAGSVVVLAGTWSLQVHIGTAPLVVLAWALIIAILLRSGTLRAALVSLRVAIGIAVIMWLLVFGRSQNLRDLLTYALEPPDEPTQGFADGLLVGFEIAGGSVPWLLGSLDVVFFQIQPRLLPWSGFMLIVVALLALRRKDRRLAAIVLLWVVEVIAISLIRGPLLFWLVWPAFALAAVTMIAIVECAPRGRPGLMLGAIASVAAAATVLWSMEPDLDPPWQQTEAAELVEWAVPLIEAESQREVAVIAEAIAFGTDGRHLAGIVEQLDQRGVTVRTDPNLALKFGDRRSWECVALPVWWLVEPELDGIGAALDAAGWVVRETWDGSGKVTEAWYHPAWDPCRLPRRGED